jgi:hypothetical protein
MMKKNNKLLDDSESDASSIQEKEDNEINLPNEETQNIVLSSSTIDNIKGSQPMKPNALTMTKITKNNEGTHIKKTKKFGDGSFIAAEDR